MADLIGHEQQWAAFAAASNSARAPHAWLLAGPKGLGKAAFAVRAATDLVAPSDPVRRPSAVERIAAGQHPDVLRLHREMREGAKTKSDEPARNITIDQVRGMTARLRTRPTEGDRRAVMIDSIDDCEAGAANALLKILEEPPENTIFFLVSHTPGRLLPTIRSRCRVLRFAALEAGAIEQVVTARAPAMTADKIARIVAASDGIPARAIALSDGAGEAVVTALNAIVASGDPDGTLRAELARSLGGVAQREQFRAMLDEAERIVGICARDQTGDALAVALATRETVRGLARFAISGSEDAAVVSFLVGDALAGLNHERLNRIMTG